MVRLSFRTLVGVALAAALLVAGFATAHATGLSSGQGPTSNSQHHLGLAPVMGYPTDPYPDPIEY